MLFLKYATDVYVDTSVNSSIQRLTSLIYLSETCIILHELFWTQPSPDQIIMKSQLI